MRSTKRTGWVSLLLSAVVLVGALFAVLGTSAGVAPRTAAAAATTTCPSTYSFSGNPDATVPCTTSTTVVHYHPRLVISFSLLGRGRGVVRWQACGYPPSARGVTVRLELNGVITGPSGSINADGCTSDPNFPYCPPRGTYSAVDVIQGYQAVSSKLVVTASTACLTSSTSGSGLSAGSGSAGTGSAGSGASSTGSGQSGALAFTGANVLRAIVIALLAILLGLVITRVSRSRRNTAR
jgi:hypothetical protein